jgi:DNA-binding MarR family transcriptional regulator
VAEADEWITQDDAATRLKVRPNALRNAVTILKRVGVIQTKRNPEDRRYELVRVADLPKIEKAVLG